MDPDGRRLGLVYGEARYREMLVIRIRMESRWCIRMGEGWMDPGGRRLGLVYGKARRMMEVIENCENLGGTSGWEKAGWIRMGEGGNSWGISVKGRKLGGWRENGRELEEVSGESGEEDRWYF